MVKNTCVFFGYVDICTQRVILIFAVLLGKKLKSYRERYNLTVRELGELAGVSYSLISKFENGKRNPSLVFLYRLQSRLLNLSPSEFEYLLELKRKKPAVTFHVLGESGENYEWNIIERSPSTRINYFESSEKGGE